MSTTHMELPRDPSSGAPTPGTPALGAALATLRGRTRRGLLLEGAGFALPAFLGYFLVTLPLDRLFFLEAPVRGILLALWLAWVLTKLFQRVVRPMQCALGDEELTLAVERADPELGQRLISALQFERSLASQSLRGASPQLMGEVVAELPDLVSKADFGSALKRERVNRGIRRALFGVAVVGILAVVWEPFGLWARRNLLLASEPWPRETTLEVLGVENGEIVVPRGDDFTVQVEATGKIPERVSIVYVFPDGNSASEAMTQNTGEATFTYTFPGLMDPVRFYAEGGDALKKWVRVRLVIRPQVEEMRLTLAYPDYMKREALAVPPDASELVAPVGATISLEGRATKRLSSASIAVGKKQSAGLSVAEDKLAFSGVIRPTASGLLVVHLRDTDGLGEGPAPSLMLRVVPDRAPRLKALVRGVGTQITPEARIPLEITATDDFGLERLALDWMVGENAGIGSETERDPYEQAKEVEGLEVFEPGSLRFARIVRYDLLPLLENRDALSDPKNPVRPGLFVSVRFRALDNHPGADGDATPGRETGQTATSDSFTFKVVTPAELLRELVRRQNEQRVEFEKIIASHSKDMEEFRDLDAPTLEGDRGRMIRTRVAYLARHERALARRVKTVAQRYAEILDEMLNNRLGEEVRVRQLRGQIVEPLDRLSGGLMYSLAGVVAEYGRRGGDRPREEARSGYAEVRKAMLRVLRHMKRLEGFTEILNKLRGVIQLEEAAAEKAKQEYKKAVEDIFGPEKKNESGDSSGGGQPSGRNGKD